MSAAALLRKALASGCADVIDEIHRVPLTHWTESVFRFFVVRRLLEADTDLSCRSEWNRIDLVLQRPDAATLVEFKFFGSNPLLDKAGKVLRLKGGPSHKNYSEFEAVIDKLHHARSSNWSSACGPIEEAFVVLAYADSLAEIKRRAYRDYYDVDMDDSRLQSVETIRHRVPLKGDLEFTCKLLGVVVA